MYKRPIHQQIAALLGQLDGKLFADCECLFAGGTAISLQLDEYRRSDDIDFVCASTDGLDRSTLHRDYLDLSMMCLRWGPVPGSAWDKARQAYVTGIDHALDRVRELLADAAYRDRCFLALDVLPEVRGALGAAVASGSIR